jgi:hypothetical protein
MLESNVVFCEMLRYHCSTIKTGFELDLDCKKYQTFQCCIFHIGKFHGI